MRTLRTAALITLGTLVAACGGDPVAPTQDHRALALTLTSPNPDDGAVILRITGAKVDSVTAMNGGLAVRMGDGAPDVAEFVITGDPLGKVIGHAWFAEPVREGEVVVTVIEVASGTTYEVRDPVAYRVSAVAERGEPGPTF